VLNKTPDSIKYQKLYKQLNTSFYQELGFEIKAALEAEKDPTIEASETRLWQSVTSPTTTADTQDSSKLKDLFKHQLILNDKDLAKLIYWSTALMVVWQCQLHSTIVYNDTL
jgi:hypothetical protein